MPPVRRGGASQTAADVRLARTLQARKHLSQENNLAYGYARALFGSNDDEARERAYDAFSRRRVNPRDPASAQAIQEWMKGYAG